MLSSFPDGLGVKTVTTKCNTEKCVNNIIKSAMTSSRLSRLTIIDPQGHKKILEFL